MTMPKIKTIENMPQCLPHYRHSQQAAGLREPEYGSGSLDTARQAGLGGARRGAAWPGMARPGVARHREAWHGNAGTAGEAWQGMAGRGMARPGTARQRRRGLAGQGEA